MSALGPLYDKVAANHLERTGHEMVAHLETVTGLNARVVWEEIGAGRTVRDLCEPLPDEFHGWVMEIAEGLHAEASAILDAAEAEHARIIANLPDGWTATSNGKPQADSPRYRQLGNAVAVPVFEWVARRLVAADSEVAA